MKKERVLRSRILELNALLIIAVIDGCKEEIDEFRLEMGELIDELLQI
jgi:hypothetical protein